LRHRSCLSSSWGRDTEYARCASGTEATGLVGQNGIARLGNSLSVPAPSPYCLAASGEVLDQPPQRIAQPLAKPDRGDYDVAGSAKPAAQAALSNRSCGFSYESFLGGTDRNIEGYSPPGLIWRFSCL